MARKLLILQGDRSMEVQFDQQITIGRDVFNSLSLQDAEVSRSHAIIFEQDGEVIIKDLKSRNGCYVRGEKATDAQLHSGDEIILGASVIIYDPPDEADLSSLLSKRGRYLIERSPGGGAGKSGGVVAPVLERPQPTTIFTRDQMDEAVDKLFNDPEATSFFSLSNALNLLKAMKEMDDAVDAGELFDCAVSHALGLVGGHRGVIMEVDASRENIKVRSLITLEDTNSIQVAPPILKLVLGSGNSVFCSDVLRDKRFAQIGKQSKRAIHSFATVPIVGRDELYGFMYLDSEENSVSYDFTALRSMYIVAGHLGALLRKRPMHFSKHAAAMPGLQARA